MEEFSRFNPIVRVSTCADIIVMFETDGIGQTPSAFERYLVTLNFVQSTAYENAPKRNISVEGCENQHFPGRGHLLPYPPSLMPTFRLLPSPSEGVATCLLQMNMNVVYNDCE